MTNLKLLTVSSEGEISYLHKSVHIPTMNINVKKRIKYNNIKSDRIFAKEIELKVAQAQIIAQIQQLYKDKLWGYRLKSIKIYGEMVRRLFDKYWYIFNQKDLERKKQSLADKYNTN